MFLWTQTNSVCSLRRTHPRSWHVDINGIATMQMSHDSPKAPFCISSRVPAGTTLLYSMEPITTTALQVSSRRWAQRAARPESFTHCFCHRPPPRLVCARYMSASCAELVQPSGSLSSRTRRNRGNRRLNPRSETAKPNAAR